MLVTNVLIKTSNNIVIKIKTNSGPRTVNISCQMGPECRWMQQTIAVESHLLWNAAMSTFYVFRSTEMIRLVITVDWSILRKGVSLPPYLCYRDQVVAGIRCAEAEHQWQSYSRTEKPNFNLVFQIMWQIPCQNIEIELQWDHCQVPVTSRFW